MALERSSIPEFTPVSNRQDTYGRVAAGAAGDIGQT
jgi:hypothetical protein